MLKLSELSIVESHEAFKDIPEGKVLINTINAHSFNVAQSDQLFADALRTVGAMGYLTVECLRGRAFGGTVDLWNYGTMELRNAFGGSKELWNHGFTECLWWIYGSTELWNHGGGESRRLGEEAVGYQSSKNVSSCEK